MANGNCCYQYIFQIGWVFVWYLRREDSRPHWGLCGMVQELNFLAGGIYTIKVIKQRDFAVLEY